MDEITGKEMDMLAAIYQFGIGVGSVHFSIDYGQVYMTTSSGKVKLNRSQVERMKLLFKSAL